MVIFYIFDLHVDLHFFRIVVYFDMFYWKNTKNKTPPNACIQAF